MSLWSFIAQRATTGEFLDWDVPLDIEGGGPEWQLNGSGSLKATVAPDVGGLRADDGHLLLEEWGTLLYPESSDEIRGGFVVIKCSFEGDAWHLEGAGFSTYPHGIPYDDEYSQIGVDPVDAFKEVWRHVQSYPDADLGVTVTGDATPVRLGTDAWDETVDGNPVHHDAEPYALLWWDHPDCGDELDALAKQAPFDWVEHHRWADDHESIVHEIRVGYPRLGTRRTDLLFDEGVNVTNVLTVESNGDEFANAIDGLGAGEGKAMLRRSTGQRDGRLRRVAVLTDKTVTDPARMDALIADEMAARKAALRILGFDVVDHPNARIGSWQLGDDVKVRAEVPWLGEIELWVRVTGWSLTGEDTAHLDVTRSDLFTYGG